MRELVYQGEKIIIHEFNDAQKCIQRLSDMYTGDLTIVARGGNGRNKIEYYN